MKYFDDILAGNTHKPKNKPAEEGATAEDAMTSMLEKVYNKIMGTADTSPIVQAGGRACMDILDDLRFGEDIAKRYAEHIQELRKLNITQLYTILHQWRSTYDCKCGDPGHKANLILMHDLMPIIKDEVQKRMIAAK